MTSSSHVRQAGAGTMASFVVETFEGKVSPKEYQRGIEVNYSNN